MTTAKLNIQHDYITLRVKFGDGSKFNFTRSYGGAKVSGNHATRQALEFFDALTKQGSGTLREKFERLRAVAETSATMNDFIANAA